MANSRATGRSIKRVAGAVSARLAHVGIAVSDLSAHARFYRDVLRLEPVQVDDMDGARIEAFAAGDTLVELLEPESDDSPVGRFLAKRGVGIHHLCFAVADLDEALKRCREAAIRLIDETPRVGAEGKRIAFLHPSSTGGILIELSES
jgi:methylmalonyl-CoA/ethylmalonyl-CoA epimerase